VDQESQSNKGYVYILLNPAFPGFVKVGKTTKDPETRAREVSVGSGVPAPYAVAWDALVSDCHAVERILHQELAHTRARADREFFAVPLKKAIAIASRIAAPFSCEAEEPSEGIQPEIGSAPTPAKSAPKLLKPSAARPHREELIEVAEDCPVDHAVEPPGGKPNKIRARVAYEILSECPYRYTEIEFFHELDVVRRNRPNAKIESYSIKRSPLVQSYGWGIHRNAQGKLGLVAMESDGYRELQGSIKRTRSYRKSKA